MPTASACTGSAVSGMQGGAGRTRMAARAATSAETGSRRASVVMTLTSAASVSPSPDARSATTPAGGASRLKTGSTRPMRANARVVPSPQDAHERVGGLCPGGPPPLPQPRLRAGAPPPFFLSSAVTPDNLRAVANLTNNDVQEDGQFTSRSTLSIRRTALLCEPQLLVRFV